MSLPHINWNAADSVSGLGMLGNPLKRKTSLFLIQRPGHRILEFKKFNRAAEHRTSRVSDEWGYYERFFSYDQQKIRYLPIRIEGAELNDKAAFRL